jgi:hypothetical protein
MASRATRLNPGPLADTRTMGLGGESMSRLERLRESGLLEPAAAAVAIGAVLLALDYRNNFPTDSTFGSQLLVEAHGMLLELILLGCVLFWFERRRERRETIVELRRQLEGLRLADDPHSLAIKCALVRRLSDEGLPVGNLFAIKLPKQHLPGINWTHAQLGSSHLSGSMLDNAVLEGADIRHADLTNCCLRFSKCAGASFAFADLTGASFIGADLRDADFQGATLIGVDFTRADLTGAILMPASSSGAIGLPLSDGTNQSTPSG